ncbi:unnamed protein product [Caenorhabditis brenneri]
MDFPTSTNKSNVDNLNSCVQIAVPASNNCQICDQPAHGQHFGALTCRACAAFFRRCHFSKETKTSCQFLKSKCKPDSKGRWNCKKCRLDRCIAYGMTTINIQYDRDLFRSSEAFLKKRLLSSILTERVPATVESVLGSPHYICFKRKDSPAKREITFIDMSDFTEKLAISMEEVSTDYCKFRKLSNLEQLARGLNDYRTDQKQFLIEATLITKETAISSWENNIFTVANWLNYSEFFRNLPIHLRMELLQTTWLIWGKLERIAMTAEMRVNRKCGKNQFVVSHEHLIDYCRFKADMSWWSPYSFDELEYLFNPKDLFYDELVWEIIDTQPDPVELTYLLCSLSFGLAGSSVSSELQVIVDQFQEILANDLHNYYTKKNKIAYTLRLRQLMKVNEMFLKLRNLRTEKYYICSILGVFELHISNGEFFRVSC